MTIDEKIKDEKLQYYIIRETVKISALSSSEIDKYKYIAVDKVLSSDQSRITQ